MHRSAKNGHLLHYLLLLLLQLSVWTPSLATVVSIFCAASCRRNIMLYALCVHERLVNTTVAVVPGFGDTINLWGHSDDDFCALITWLDPWHETMHPTYACCINNTHLWTSTTNIGANTRRKSEQQDFYVTLIMPQIHWVTKKVCYPLTSPGTRFHRSTTPGYADEKHTIQTNSESNQGHSNLTPDALPLSYMPKWTLEQNNASLVRFRGMALTQW